MTQLNQITIIGILLIIGALIVVGIVVMVKPVSRAANHPLPSGVLAQSKQYVKTLGAKPFESLTTAQKLLLLHASYNLKKYQTVTQHAEVMIEAFQRLAPERKQAFSEMVEESYRQLGRAQDAAAFRQQIGL